MDRLPRWFAGRTATWGLIGAVALLVGLSWYQALITPPYRFTDEQAHAGYVLAVQRGQLPSIDTRIDAAHGGVALRTRLAAEPPRRRTVWGANNPPVAYVVAAPVAAATRALGLPGGPLLGLRLVNVVAAAAAVALAYRLARDLAGHDPVIGLVAAGLVAATPHLGFVTSLGSTDGLAILASTGVLSALARTCGAGRAPTDERIRGDVRELGLWCAAAAAVRPMALVFAVVAATIALVVVLVRRRCSPWWAFGWLAVPALLTSGWWYALNVHRYGDPTGSSALFDRFGRQPAGSLWSTLRLTGMWQSLLRTIATRRLEAPLPGDPRLWYQAALAVVVIGTVGTVVLVASSTVRARRPRPAGPTAGARGATRLPGGAWLAVAAVALVPLLLTAQHRAGGGAAHPRYLLPVVPVVAAAVALVAVRAATRWAGAALVLGAAAVTILQTRAAARWLAANPSGPPGSELVAAYGGELVRGAGFAVAGLGLALFLVALAAAPRADGTDALAQLEGSDPSCT